MDWGDLLLQRGLSYDRKSQAPGRGCRELTCWDWWIGSWDCSLSWLLDRPSSAQPLKGENHSWNANAVVSTDPVPRPSQGSAGEGPRHIMNGISNACLEFPHCFRSGIAQLNRH